MMNASMHETQTTTQKSRDNLLAARMARGTPSSEVSPANRSRMSPIVSHFPPWSAATSWLSSVGWSAADRQCPSVEFAWWGEHIGSSSVLVWSMSSALSLPRPLRLVLSPFIVGYSYLQNTQARIKIYAWFPPFRCRSAVAVSPFPLRKFRKKYVSAVITLPYVTNSVAPLPLPPAVAP